jgi:exopolysaccharide biosynthesis protein
MVAVASPSLKMEVRHVQTDSGYPRGSPLSERCGPRTAVDIDEEAFVYIVVVDGRSMASIGMSLAEHQKYLSPLELVNATNLDGGGSST